jgi:nucleoside-diphosphate-sugar epimerase
MYAVIGGSGFLGSSLCRLFNKNDISYTNFDLVNSEDQFFRELDVTNISDGDLANHSCIINLAAEHKDDVKPVEKYYHVNVKGAEEVCDHARKENIDFIIFLSSVAVYGFAPPNTGEDGAPNFFNEYGRTKHLAEKVYLKWQQEDPENRRLIIIRPTVIFGPGNRGNVYNLFNQIFKKRFVMFGDGNNQKSMAYVENVAAFIMYILNSNPNLQIYNYVDKPDLSMNKLILLIRKTLFKKNNIGLRFPNIFGFFIGKSADFISMITGKSLPVSSIRIKKFMSTTQFSSSIPSTGFVAPFELKDGLIKTLTYEFLEDNSENRTFKTE